jgi:beta-lactamase class A
MQRRSFLLAASAAPFAGTAWAKDKATQALEQALRGVESRVGGRLGVAALDTGSGRLAARRGRERFPMCSTFKLLLAAHVLRRVDQGLEQLDHRIAYTRADLLDYSPVTGPHAQDGGMTVAELCEAAMVLSDNTAANLLLARQGGPQALTGWVRSLGDPATRLDRNEPSLNDVPPGDERDTTTPLTMLHTLQAVALGETLSPASRDLLQGWLLGNRTGGQRLRAGLPDGWRAGNKTGTGPRGTINDIGVLWPPGRAPVVVTCYLTGSPGAEARREAAIAEVGKLVAAWALA